MKKIAKLMVGVCLAGVVLVSVKAEAKAALPCTYDIIYDANGNITNGKQMLEAAKLNLGASQALYNELKKSGTASALELQQAADAVTNATNVVRWWTDQVNNSNTYLGNIKDREKFEDDFINNRAALADLVTLQQAQAEVNSALEMANGVLSRINDIDKAINSYQNQLSAHPEYQVSIDELNKRRASLQSEYNEKFKIYNEKKATYENYSKTLNYAAYDRSIEDYAHAREINRSNPNWKK